MDDPVVGITRLGFGQNHPARMWSARLLDECIMIGDLATKQADGSILILGRRDSMVKLYGIRIDLEAIESALRSFPGVCQAAVKVRGEGNEARLWAWYSAEERVKESDLRRHLSRSLPNYMIPAFWVRMEELPLNPSGKLNRSALT